MPPTSRHGQASESDQPSPPSVRTGSVNSTQSILSGKWGSSAEINSSIMVRAPRASWRGRTPNRSAAVSPGGGCTGLPVNGLIGPPFEFVKDARSGACPDGSMTRTRLPSREGYSVPADPVGRATKPASSKPWTNRLLLVETTTPSALATKSAPVFAATPVATTIAGCGTVFRNR